MLVPGFSPSFSGKTKGSQNLNLTHVYDLTYLQIYCNLEAPHAASYEFLVSYTKGSTAAALPCSQEPQKLPRRCHVEGGKVDIIRYHYCLLSVHFIGVSSHIANKNRSWPDNLSQLGQRASGGSKGCLPFGTPRERSCS